MGRKGTALKYGAAALVFLAVAGGAGAFMAVQYHSFEQEFISLKAQRQQRAAAAAEQRAASRQKQVEKNEENTSPAGSLDTTDDYLKSLTESMVVRNLPDGSTLYSCPVPTQDGVYVIPYLVQQVDRPHLYLSVRYIGREEISFSGVDVRTDEKHVFHVRGTAAPTVEHRSDGAVIERYELPADARTLQMLRQISQHLGGTVTVPDRATMVNRNITSDEAIQIKSMVELYKYLRQ